MDHHHAEYNGDYLSDAQKHGGHIIVDWRIQFREYQNGESLQSRTATEVYDEEARGDQKERPVEGLFGVGSPELFLVGSVISRLLNRLAERLKFILHLWRAYPAPQPTESVFRFLETTLN